MEVTLASVKSKDAGDSLWQNFVGDLKGAAVNLFLRRSRLSRRTASHAGFRPRPRFRKTELHLFRLANSDEDRQRGRA